MQEYRHVNAHVRVVNGGIGIDWGYLGIEQERFMGFIYSMWEVAGFARPSQVPHTRNGLEGRTDWNRLRVTREGCEEQQIDPIEACEKIRTWLADQQDVPRYGIYFDVVENAVT